MEDIFPTLGKKIIHLNEVDSTNAYALHLLSKTNPIEGTVIRADNQTNGRGQIGRYWHSDPELNLLCSIITYPTFLLATDQFILSKVFSLGILNYLFELGIDNATIKWPNDIYIGNYKVAGMLIQNQISKRSIKNAVIGFGINVNQKVWPKELPNPISISTVTSKNINITVVLSGVLKHINDYYTKLIFGDKAVIDEEYNRRLYLSGQNHTFFQEDHEIMGKIIGVDLMGHLLIQNSNGDCHKYRFRELSFERRS